MCVLVGWLLCTRKECIYQIGMFAVSKIYILFVRLLHTCRFVTLFNVYILRTELVQIIKSIDRLIRNYSSSFACCIIDHQLNSIIENKGDVEVYACPTHENYFILLISKTNAFLMMATGFRRRKTLKSMPAY